MPSSWTSWRLTKARSRTARLKEDLGIDSLEVVDVIVLVEEEFGFKMQREDFKELKTYGEFCQFIAGKVA